MAGYKVNQWFISSHGVRVHFHRDKSVGDTDFSHLMALVLRILSL